VRAYLSQAFLLDLWRYCSKPVISGGRKNIVLQIVARMCAVSHRRGVISVLKRVEFFCLKIRG